MTAKIKEYLSIIKYSWTWNHKHFIITLSLITVILWQNYADRIPKIELTADVIAYSVEAETIKSDCDYRCLVTEWVELRTSEIMLENEASYRLQSRNQALLEANDMILEI